MTDIANMADITDIANRINRSDVKYLLNLIALSKLRTSNKVGS